MWVKEGLRLDLRAGPKGAVVAMLTYERTGEVN